MSRRTTAAFFVVAFLFRIAIAASTGMFHRTVLTEMEGIAWHVSTAGHYALYNNAPTAYCTPPFPLFLAAVFSLVGSGAAARAVCVIVACTASALRCALIPRFAVDAGFDSGMAKLAGWLSVFYIAALDTEANGGLDGPYVALALLLVIWGAMRIWRNRTWQTRTHWWFFVFCGFAAFLNPGLLPVMGGLLVFGAIACPRDLRSRYLGQAAAAAAGILLFLAPWAVRNQISLGAPILTRSNFGTEFWVSNGPDRTFDHPYNYATYHPTLNPAEARLVSELGEPEYNRQRFAEGLEWVRSNPTDYLLLTLKRTAAWWFPPHPYILLAPKLLLTLLAFGGMRLMFRRQPLVAWLFLITWITFPDVYYLVQWSSRYRYPMDWQLVFAAAVPLAAGWQAIGARQQAAREAAAAA